MQDGTAVGILGQDVGEERGAGAALADDDDRRFDDLVGNLRMALVGVLDPQPRLEQLQQFRAGADAAQQVELGVLFQGFDEDLERLAPIVAAEIRQAGGAHGGVEQ
jgi:hypothetical protein